MTFVLVFRENLQQKQQLNSCTTGTQLKISGIPLPGGYCGEKKPVAAMVN
jgi:hypothetical protein